ncbi:MAG: LysM peptidoglycan-binding domain-containing protein, partial [Taibaiella sp.]|nr:LysM peptidoglycan-binding domain-containing protein [Taibaiella sp.]
DSAQKIIPQPVSNIALAAPPPPLSDTAKKVVAAATPADTAKVTASAASFGEVKDMADKARAVIAAEEKPAPVTKSIMVTDTVATAIPKPAPDFDSGKLVTVNGLKAFYAYKGDMLLQYAVKYNIRYPHLLEINDLADAPLADNTIIYLEKKLNSGTHARHTVKETDNIYLIAQEESMSLRRLQALNMLEPGEEPATGVFLELQNGATRKPALRPAPPANLKTGNNLSYVKPTPADNYIQIDHSATADAGANTVPVKKEIERDAYVTTIPVPVDSSKSGIKTSIDTGIVKISEASNRILDSIIKEDTTQDEFAVLKAKLDKVVYSGKPKAASQSATSQPAAAAVVEPVGAGENESGIGEIKLTPISEKPERKPAKPVFAASKRSGYYTVKKGDNLSRIADKNNVTVKQLVRLNHVEADELQPGQKLRIK